MTGPVPEVAPTFATVVTSLLERLQDEEVSWGHPTMMQWGSLGAAGGDCACRHLCPLGFLVQKPRHGAGPSLELLKEQSFALAPSQGPLGAKA